MKPNHPRWEGMRVKPAATLTGIQAATPALHTRMQYGEPRPEPHDLKSCSPTIILYPTLCYLPPLTNNIVHVPLPASSCTSTPCTACHPQQRWPTAQLGDTTKHLQHPILPAYNCASTLCTTCHPQQKCLAAVSPRPSITWQKLGSQHGSLARRLGKPSTANPPCAICHLK